MSNSSLEEKVRRYAKTHSLTFQNNARFSFGQDGDIWKTTRPSVVKVFHRQLAFQFELYAYQRLDFLGISEIDGLAIPQLLRYDGQNQIVEMTLVTPPYLLDFGKARFEPPDFSDETMQEWLSALREWFGKDTDRVLYVIGILESYGIFYRDARPSNICFHPSDDP